MIDAPTAPELGFRLVILGVARTVKLTPLLATPATVMTTVPLVAPDGTGTVMLVALQDVGVPAMPLNFTVLVPCVDPNVNPVMVTTVPTGPEGGLKFVMLGVPRTVKLEPALATPATVTTTFPVVAPEGTGTVMLVALQAVGAPAMPLKVIVLVPWVAPKFVPVTTTAEPIGAEDGLMPVMVGVGSTLKLAPLLATPATVTTTLPVVAPDGTGTVMLVALQPFGTAEVPLNVMVLVP